MLSIHDRGATMNKMKTTTPYADESAGYMDRKEATYGVFVYIADKIAEWSTNTLDSSYTKTN